MIDRETDSTAWWRTALCVWSVLVVVIAAKLAIRPGSHTVYPSYADAGRSWRLPGGAAATRGGAYINRQYGPFFSAIMAPFAALPDRIGGPLWATASMFLLVAGFRRFHAARTNSIRQTTWSAKEMGIALLLLPLCGTHSLANGQANVPLVACLLWGVALILEGSLGWAGLALAAAVCTKVYPVAFALLFCVLLPKRLPVRLALGMLSCLLLPFLVWPMDLAVERYLRHFSYLASGEHYQLGLVAGDVHDFLEYWCFAVPRRPYMLLQLGTGLFVLASVLGFRRERSTESSVVHAYTLCSLWTVLFGPATEEATYLLVSPALGLLLVDLARTSGLRSPGFLAFAALALVIGPFQTSLFGEPVRLMTRQYRLAPAALALVWLWQLSRGFRLKQLARSSSLVTRPVRSLSVPSIPALALPQKNGVAAP